MKKIFSYNMKGIDFEPVTLPINSTILGVKDIYGVPTLFALVDPDETREEIVAIRRFRTGIPIKNAIEGMRYLDSMLEANFGTVFHFFQEGARTVVNIGAVPPSFEQLRALGGADQSVN